MTAFAVSVIAPAIPSARTAREKIAAFLMTTSIGYGQPSGQPATDRPGLSHADRLGELPIDRYRGAIPTVPLVAGRSAIALPAALRAPSSNPLKRPDSVAALITPGITRVATKRIRCFWSGMRLR